MLVADLFTEASIDRSLKVAHEESGLFDKIDKGS
jgi:hypothetical protein